MAKRVDLHVQALQDRIKRIDADILDGEKRMLAANAALADSWNERRDASARLAEALSRVSVEKIAQEGALSKERKRARNVKATRPGQYIVAGLPRGRAIVLDVHIGKTTTANEMGIVPVITLCKRAVDMGRDVALRAARDTHGDLGITLGKVRAMRHQSMSGRVFTCTECITEARGLLRPAKEEES